VIIGAVFICFAAFGYYFGFDGPKLKSTFLTQVKNFVSQMVGQGEYAVATVGLVESLIAALIRGANFGGIVTELNDKFFHSSAGSILSWGIGFNTFALAFATRNSIASDKKYKYIQLLRGDVVDNFAANKSRKEFLVLNAKILPSTVLYAIPLSIPFYLALGPVSILPVGVIAAFLQRGAYRVNIRHQMTTDPQITYHFILTLCQDIDKMIAFLKDPKFAEIEAITQRFARVGHGPVFFTQFEQLKTQLSDVQLGEVLFNKANRPQLQQLITASGELIAQMGQIPQSVSNGSQQYTSAEYDKVLTFLKTLNGAASGIDVYLYVPAGSLEKVPHSLNLNKDEKAPAPYVPSKAARYSVMYSGFTDLVARALGASFFVGVFLAMAFNDPTIVIALSIFAGLIVVKKHLSLYGK